MSEMSDTRTTLQTSDLSYEEKTDRIKELIRSVQQGSTLSATLDAAKEGALLIQACNLELEKAEKEMAALFEGGPDVTPSRA